MNRFSLVDKILKKESEDWINYLHGQKLNSLEHLKRETPKYTSIFLHTLSFFVYLFRLFIRALKSKKSKKSKIEFYIYAGTFNEANSLVSTAKALLKKNKVVLANSSNKHILSSINKVFEFEQLDVGVSDVILAIVLFIYKAPILYFRLKKKDKLLVDNFFNSFCQSYIYLPIFCRLLNDYQPDFVLVSNDHNVDCRSILAVAYKLGIKTVYMQHASVSEIFPALTVNYAFLDGESALNIYLKCEKNISDFYENRTLPKIFLSGQKKILNQSSIHCASKVGLAINSLDNIVKVINLVNELVTEGFLVSLRWHPGQKESDIALIKESFRHFSMVTLSDPMQESIGNYLANLYCLISGNSSIHLEAAVASVAPIYYEIECQYFDDYYGFEKNNLVYKVNNLKDLLNSIRKENIFQPDPLAVKYYSATYNTEWYMREGELVATILVDIKKSKSFTNMFGAKSYVPIK